MSEAITLLAMFEDFEPASKGVEKLHELGLNDDDMNVISGIPIKNTILGRPSAITYVSRIGMLGAGMGVALGIFLIFGIPYLYSLLVCGQPLISVPHGLIIFLEMTLLRVNGFSLLCKLFSNA